MKLHEICCFFTTIGVGFLGELPGRNRLVTGECEDHAFLVKKRAVSRERGRPRPQQRVLRLLVLSAELHKIAQIFCSARRMGGTSVCSSAGKQTLAPPSAQRARIAHRNHNRPFTKRAGTPALPTAHTPNTLSTRMPPVTSRLRSMTFRVFRVFRGKNKTRALPS